MQKRAILSVTLITALLVAAFLLFNSSTPVEKKETPATPAPTCCKQNTKECVDSKTNGSGDMIIDNLSRQFISIPVFSN
jgi:hypothetical protein